MTSARSIPRRFLGRQSIIKMFHFGGSGEMGSTSPKVRSSLSIAIKPLTTRLCSRCPLHPHYFFSATLFQVLPVPLCPRGSYLLSCVSNLHLYVSVFYRSLSFIVPSNLHVSLCDRSLMTFFWTAQSTASTNSESEDGLTHNKQICPHITSTHQHHGPLSSWELTVISPAKKLYAFYIPETGYILLRCHFNVVHILTPYFSKINCAIIKSSKHRDDSWEHTLKNNKKLCAGGSVL
jgi:hypothetical protein